MKLTEEIIQAAGHAKRVQRIGWVAGMVPLNGQIVQDTIEDGLHAIDPPRVSMPVSRN